MYRLTNDPDSVIRVSDKTLIPRGHRWWSEFEDWMARGNEPEQAPDLRGVEGRARRDSLLRSSDWTQLDDSPLSAAVKLAWANYRAALRALTAMPGFPEVTWPTPPDMPTGSADQAPPQI